MTTSSKIKKGNDPLIVDPRKHIIIKGAKVHNLQNVNLAIPKNNLIVVTGVSGSGKSSLAIDTLYAEGQRRYVESLSSYARQFLMRMNKPDVEYIKGICPAIAIQQKVHTRNSRSTVGSLTEVYDYLRLLYARIGRTYSPVSGKEVKKHEVADVVDFIHEFEEDDGVQILVPFKQIHSRSIKEELSILLQKGFTRIIIGKKIVFIEDILKDSKLAKPKGKDQLFVLIDRFKIKLKDEANRARVADSVQTAFFEGEGECIVEVLEKKTQPFSNKFEMDGMIFSEPNPQFFNFNSPFGACDTCEGFGSIIGIDEDLVVPNKGISIYEGAIACWRGAKMKKWNEKLIENAEELKFPIHRPYKELTNDEKKIVWEGSAQFRGLNKFFGMLERKSYKIQYRVLLSRYRGRTLCPNCNGSRLKDKVGYVKIRDKSISDILSMPISEVLPFFTSLKPTKTEAEISSRLFIEVKSRIQFMINVGLGYLTLSRSSKTLSGGEIQRINLTRALGSNLTSSLYILDEPSIGLHPKDTGRLIKVLESLRDLGNTVVIVEHDEEIMRSANYIIDMGPFAGNHGGNIVFCGPYKSILNGGEGLTAKYLTGVEKVEMPKMRRKGINHIEIKGARQHNLKNINVKIPLNTLMVVTGVSGSGKTTLLKDILYPVIKHHFGEDGDKPGAHDEFLGDISTIHGVELVDQNPLGRSSRSNPVTYIKAYNVIRELFAKQQLSKIRGFKPKHFSFNVDGGRCETCKGEGETVVEMQFLADIHLVCEECDGDRFKVDVLDVHYREKNIAQVLDMTVDEAIDFFEFDKEVARRLKPLADVGLGYIHLGQPSSTLSGGEAQRVKLASFLTKGGGAHPLLFIFDEPTTGLHFHDIKKLLTAFNALIENGHSIIVIEHNIEIIKNADWILDLGPDGGDKGGEVIYSGTPEGMIKCKESHTAQYLKEKLVK